MGMMGRIELLCRYCRVPRKKYRADYAGIVGVMPESVSDLPM